MSDVTIQKDNNSVAEVAERLGYREGDVRPLALHGGVKGSTSSGPTSVLRVGAKVQYAAGGHFSTKSRGYSTTLRLPDARITWRRDHHRGLEHTETETILIVGVLSTPPPAGEPAATRSRPTPRPPRPAKTVASLERTPARLTRTCQRSSRRPLI